MAWLAALRRRFGLAGAFAAYGITIATFGSRLPTIKDGLGLTEGRLSLALLGLPLGLIVAMRFTPPLVAWRSSAWLTRSSLAAVALCLPLLGLAAGVATLGGALILLGLSLGALDTAMNTQGIGLERRLNRPVMSALHGVYGIGFVAGTVAGSVAAGGDLRPVWHFALASTVLTALCWSMAPGLLRTEVDVPAVDGPVARRPAMRDHRFLIIVGVMAFCCYLAEGAVDNWSGIYLREAQGASLGLAPIAATAFGIGITAARFAADPLIARVGRATVLPPAAMLGAAGMALALMAPSPGVAVAGYAILGVGVAPIVPICFSLAGEAPGVPPAWAIARVTAIAYVGLFAGPPLIGGLAELVGLSTALGLVAVLLAMIVVLSRAARPPGAAPGSG